MKTRLTSGLSRKVRADRAFLRHEITGPKWVEEHQELTRTTEDTC